jgi:DNA modification methylase
MTNFPAYKTVSVAELVPYARNSRTHSPQQVDKIAASIREFGFLNPVIVDGQNGIVAGHGRVMAAQKLGLEVLPVIEAAHLTEAQKRAYVIADNRLALDAGWDNELLKVELQDLDAQGFDLTLTGFDIDEIGAFLDEPTEGLTDEDAVPDVPAQPVTVEGDVWVLGRHRLMCGDSTSIDAVERLMDGRRAQAVITDPPYNQETEGGFSGEIGKSLKKQSADIEHMCDFQVEPFLQILPVVHEKGKMNATVFCNKDLVPDYLAWARGSGYSFNILVWKKPSAIPLGGSYMPDVEYCLVFRKSGIFNTKVPGVSYSKVLSHGRETGLHPTMKPVAMLENQIQIVSDIKATVLDLFGGSGSTLIACEKTARDCRMMELDSKYCDVIINRWQDFTGQTAMLEATGQTFAELEAERIAE